MNEKDKDIKYWKKECKSFQKQLDELQEAYDLAMREINKLREKIK
ncbi:MAG TPA: hypothetical protein VI911_07415 [Patescibacteria group bacterium]|nr:hypothetical protein [Patescibacteria group bacterium]